MMYEIEEDCEMLYIIDKKVNQVYYINRNTNEFTVTSYNDYKKLMER